MAQAMRHTAKRMAERMTRRTILAGATAGMAAMATPKGIFSNSQNTLKVGLVGCGGRGTGAAIDNFNAANSAGMKMELYAMGDLFADRAQSSFDSLKERLGDSFRVMNVRRFSGWDAYKNVIDSGVDVVILATPPGFRPMMLDYAVKAGKNVFMEKPVAVDAPGIRTVMAAGEMAKQKNLAIVAGTQRRHDQAYNEVMKRVHDGEIGDIVAGYCYWNQGALWHKARTDGWSEMEWQVRNWLYFTWLSGDHICEQHIHNIDVINWAKQMHPVSAYGMGGRQVRTDPVYGHIYDHFAVEFVYPDGTKAVSMCRQQDGTDARVSEFIQGTKGTSNCSNRLDSGSDNLFRWRGEKENPYMLEHKHMYESIEAGEPLNEAKQVAESTMSAIMGREACYTGKLIKWEEFMNDEKTLGPAEFSFGPVEFPPVAMPGKTQ